MKRKNTEKTKGEITSQQLVLIIILIVSFAVILFFLFRMDFGRLSEREICHNSVFSKATSRGFIGDLDCKTDYVCISGGQKCEEMNVKTTVKVNPENKEEIMNAIAEEMANCWWMFGEGKLNYLGIDEKRAWGRTTCAICSIIKFDKSILDKNHSISYREFYNYLNNVKIKGSETYFSYLYDSSDVDEFQKITYLKIDIDDTNIIDNQDYAVVTGVKNTAFWGLVKGDIFIYSYYVKTRNIPILNCQEFVTKS